jgi:hypothetical protein
MMNRIAGRLFIGNSNGKKLLNLAVALAIAFALLAAFAFWHPRSVLIRINAEDIHPLRGNAYATVLPAPRGWLPMSYRGDSYETKISRLQMLENSLSFGIPHAIQSSVETQGYGRYLHLRGTELYFSTPDNSDPRTNGRIYQVIVPVTPNANIVSGMFILALTLVTFAIVRRRTMRTCQSDLLGTHICTEHFLFGIMALTWLVLVWEPAPLILDNGDAGNVASIVTGWLDRTRFVNDPVFANSGASRFYMTLAVPLTMFLTKVTHDVGQAYVLLILPLLWFQSLGFYRLGMTLFADRFWSTLLGMLSVPPVYVFSGELWGMLNVPLTRGLFAAAFPWLLMMLVRWRGTLRESILAMVVCGLSLYLHPVSAPSIALAIWVAMFLSKPVGTGWATHTSRLFVAGMVFILICLPFLITFASGFPSSASIGDNEASGLAGRLLAENVGPQYYDVRVAIGQLIEGGGSGLSWGWTASVWFAGLIGFLAIDRIWPAYREDSKRLRIFCLVLLIASAGLCSIDQTIAHLAGRRPYQVDLIRNIRYLLPCMMLFAFWLLAAVSRKFFSFPLVRPLLLTIGVVITVSWWIRFPTPLVRAAEAALEGDAPDHKAIKQNREIIRRLAQLPPSSTILPIFPISAEGPGQLVGLAIRYGAFQPVAYLPKDLNFLAYSGSSQLRGWFDATNQLKAIVGITDVAQAHDALRAFYAEHKVGYVVAYLEGQTETLTKALPESGEVIDVVGPWQLLRVKR